MYYPKYQQLKTIFTNYEREQICYILKTASTQGSAQLQLLEFFQSILIEARGLDDPMELAKMIYTYKQKFLKTDLAKAQKGQEIANKIKNASVLTWKNEPPLIYEHKNKYS